MSTSTMNTNSTDRIEKQVVLKAPVKRVWRAVTDAGEFGSWFGVKLAGSFAAGKEISGQITYPGYEHLTMAITIEKIEPERLFSFRWHPNAIVPNKDYSAEPTTLVVFELSEVAGGTLVKVTESGFDKLPAERREQAYRGNEGGWAEQMRNIEKYVSKSI
jgi:uncharacterized protein YndB with AHSA1/START domain